MCTRSSQRWSLSHYYWYEARDSSTLFTLCWQGNSSSCITTAGDAKSLLVLSSSTTHERTLKKLRGSGAQLLYPVQGIREWLTRVNSNRQWKRDPFLYVRKKISEHGLEKKKRKKFWIFWWFSSKILQLKFFVADTPRKGFQDIIRKTYAKISYIFRPSMLRPFRLVIGYQFFFHCAALTGIRCYLVEIFALLEMPIKPNWLVVSLFPVKSTLVVW